MAPLPLSFSDLSFIWDSNCPARFLAGATLAYSAYLSVQVFAHVPTKSSGVKMAIHYNLKGEPDTYVQACIGATAYPVLIATQIALASHYASTHADMAAVEAATPPSERKCPIPQGVPRLISDTLFGTSLVTLLGQHFATRAVLDHKTPEAVEEADSKPVEQHMHGHQYRIPVCLVVTSALVTFLPTALFAIGAKHGVSLCHNGAVAAKK